MKELSLAGGDTDIVYARNPRGLFNGLQRRVVSGRLIADELVNVSKMLDSFKAA
jgi:hypothetical protein